MNNTLDHALALASRGIPVFPYDVDKRPLTPHGFQDATTDPEIISAWAELWPDALIGMPTGELSGIAVVDIDVREGKDGRAWLADHGHMLAGARRVKTRSGGLHVYFQHPPGLRSSAGKIAPGVDVRAEGGYVVRWDCHGGEATGEPTPMPAELHAALLARQPRKQAALRDPEDLAPPSAQAVVDLLDSLPHPEDLDRDDWLRVGMAARGCCQGLEARGDDPRAAEIGEAWARWSARWPLYDGADDLAKWYQDFMARDAALAGWPHLVAAAIRLGVDPSPWTRGDGSQADADFAEFIAAARVEAASAADRLLDDLSIGAWAELDVPPVKQFLGWALVSASRMFLVGSTGLGKSQLSHAIGAAIASGRPFLHWQTTQARVLIVDGEMSTRLLKSRLAAVIRRNGADIPARNLAVYALDRSEQFAKLHPQVGQFQPLNTEDGCAFAQRLLRLVRPEVVIFDNVMSLVAGDQKDEVPWNETLPLVQWITGQGIAQLWLDHTGHNRTRQYGSATKAWRFDTVGVMTEREGKAATLPGEVSFKLSFDAPAGKARERDSLNRGDFAPRYITMSDAGWRQEPADAVETAAAPSPPAAKLPEALARWYQVWRDWSGDDRSVVGLFAAASRAGLIEPLANGEPSRVRDKKTQPARNAKRRLIELGWWRMDGERIVDAKAEAEEAARVAGLLG
jgi:hypothetical protein